MISTCSIYIYIYRPVAITSYFCISLYTATPPPPCWCTTAVADYGGFALVIVGKCHFSLCCLCSPCSQPNEGAVLNYAWIYPTHCNLRGHTPLDVLKTRFQNKLNTFSVDTPPRGTPTWQRSHDSYAHINVNLRQLQRVCKQKNLHWHHLCGARFGSPQQWCSGLRCCIWQLSQRLCT